MPLPQDDTWRPEQQDSDESGESEEDEILLAAREVQEPPPKAPDQEAAFEGEVCEKLMSPATL